jgi:hypothetical protein
VGRPPIGDRAMTEAERKRRQRAGASMRRPDSKAGRLRAAILALLAEHDRDGALPTSLRFLFYELVQREVVSKKQQLGADGRPRGRRPDQDLGDALTDLREDGLVPWHWIVDETRTLDDFTGFASIRDGMLSRLTGIRLDPWDGAAPLILTESRSLAGVLRAVTWDYAVRIAATNGQCGGFLHNEIKSLLSAGDCVLYLGDYDLAGGQIEANTRRVLERDLAMPLAWERLALTAEQAQDLPRIIKTDRRYADGRPHEAVETEALSQTEIVRIVREALDALLPEPLADVLEREEQERAAMRRRLRRR